jgi:Pectinesterase
LPLPYLYSSFFHLNLIRMSEEKLNLEAFRKSSAVIFAEAFAKAQALPPNMIQVWPGGATFSTIQSAIDSIGNASPQLQYQVAVGSGTYKETVTMKDYVYIVGSGQTNTFITAQGQGGSPTGVVNTASNCGISELTITATGGGWGTWPAAVKLMGTGKFHISGVTMISSDSGNPGNNVRGITNNTGSYGGQLIIGQCIIKASGVDQSTTEAMELFGMNGLTVYMELTAIEVAASQSFGVTTAVGANVTLTDCKITASTWALYNSDGMSPITANQCAINGPVSNGVVVNP